MICVYDIGNDNYTGNGDAVLVPTEAKLKMVAGGNYDLTMNHPMDPDGKWKHLKPGAIVRVPVPEEEIENAFAGMDADVYRVTSATDLREGPSEPTTITYPAWNISADYAVGDKVSHNNKNYECTYYDETSAWASIAPSVCNWWKEIARSTPGAAVLVSLPVGSELYFVQDVDSTWYKMSTYYGIEGYVRKNKVTFDRHLTPSETKPRYITDQLLRITNASADTKNRTVSVTAQHVSYDLNGVIIKDISISQASPGMALARITDGFMITYPGTIATNLSSDGHGTYTNDIKGKSGMYALLDPDKGIVSTFSAAFRRDNWDLFVMEKTDTDRGFRLRRQKNVLGVNWTRKSDSLINRVVPVAKHEGGEDLYLPEVWVDSPRISEYPIIRMEMLTVKGEVGKDKGTGDGSVWTEEELQEEMREKARERFTVDKVDQVITEVTVDFEMLGATAEYPEMRVLESVLLYDKVTVIDETIGLDTQLTVTELEWDALKKKVTAIKISNAEDRGGRSVTGYNVQAKSIGNDKLSDEVVNGIMKQVQDIIPEYADPEATRPATVEVTDGNPTLSWGNRSVVGTVQGTAMHVTMPANPAPAVVDNLTSTSTTSALSANQGKVLNDQFVDHWGKNYGTSANPIANLADLPVNGGGIVTMAASLSPNGSLSMFSFEKLGTANRYTVRLTRIRNSATYESYIGQMYDGTFNGWIRNPNGVIDNLTSTSATDALSAAQGKYIADRAVMGKSLLANNTDLNTITTVGMYGLSSSYSYTHAPSNMYMLMVGRYAPTSNSIYQLGFALAGVLHYRLYDGSNWSSWYKFVGTAE